MIKKSLIKYSPLIAIYLVIAMYALYGTAFRQKKVFDEYNGMVGTVTSFIIDTRGACAICSVVLENGTRGSVNNGCTVVKVGDTWVNEIPCYSRFLGTSGLAYCIIPHKVRSLIESTLVGFFVLIPTVLLVICLTYKLVKHWINTH